MRIGINLLPLRPGRIGGSETYVWNLLDKLSIIDKRNVYKVLQIGRFRLQGEVHQWLYDRYSLTQLLMRAGFQNPQPFSSSERQILDWTNYNLNTEPDGTIYKPNALYMEAIKT